VPRARLRIIGRNAGQFMERYGALADVQVFENVPAIEPYFRGLDVLLYAPAVGSGMKVKVLEAFAFGVPVVTNAEGVEGLPAVEGVHAGLAEDDDGLVERAVMLLQDSHRRHEQARRARELVENTCSPDRTVAQVAAVYDQMLDVPQRQACGA